MTRLSAAAASGTVTRRGADLYLGDQRWVFDGVDGYGLASDPGHNAGCGTAPSSAQLDHLFGELPPGTAVRAWAFQSSMGVDPATGRRDWAGLDRLVGAARAHHDKLILSLASQDGTCDGGQWKGPSWYASGYRQAPEGGSKPAGVVAYPAWVSAVVRRYADSPAVAMYEPVNEPEASTCAAGFVGNACYGHLSCPSEAKAVSLLAGFFDQIGGEIHRLDPRALVEEGTIGSGQCGSAGGDYASLGRSPGIDVLSVHDYSAPGALLAGDPYNGQRVRLAQAAQVAKPIIAGEIGILGTEVGGGSTRGARCPDLEDRAADLARKVDVDLHAGYSGAVVWDYQVTGGSAGCSYDLTPGDPFLSWLEAG